MGLSSWSLDHIAFSWRVIPKAFRIKDPWESWNYQIHFCAFDRLAHFFNAAQHLFQRFVGTLRILVHIFADLTGQRRNHAGMRAVGDSEDSSCRKARVFPRKVASPTCTPPALMR